MSIGYQMAREAVDLPPMDVSEVDDVTFNFTGHVAAEDSIVSVVITAEVVRRVPDEGASAMVSGSHVVGRLNGDLFVPDEAGQVVLQRFDARGRIARNLYCLRCVAEFSSKRRLALVAHVAVRRF
ncbi:MAG: hypothetical protein I8H71_01005 [Xanthomonadaceae bacterium]|nr:hypothetical protein [Xanthomonadaceae bacterium]